MVLFPPPTVVAAAVLEWIRSGQFLGDLLASLFRVTTGFIVGGALGILLGILTGQFPVISSLLSPLFHILRPIPPIAFVPIVILWFGLSEAGKLFLVVWGVFFTVWLSTHIGVQKVDRGLIRAALMLGTPRRQMLQEIVLLGALPYIVVGLRTAVSISFYTLVAAELAGAFAGIVYRIEIAQQNLQTGQVMGGLAALRSWPTGCFRRLQNVPSGGADVGTSIDHETGSGKLARLRRIGTETTGHSSLKPEHRF
ncbi:ABC transporter permease [Bradyrhizobium diazoefficiens]|nr:ABC transporter permease [Bradyrhizobium diazoefficiens]